MSSRGKKMVTLAINQKCCSGNNSSSPQPGTSSATSSGVNVEINSPQYNVIPEVQMEDSMRPGTTSAMAGVDKGENITDRQPNEANCQRGSKRNRTDLPYDWSGKQIFMFCFNSYAFIIKLLRNQYLQNSIIL